MNRRGFRLSVTAVALVVCACDGSTGEPDVFGGLSVRLTIAVAGLGALDEARAHIEGPSGRTVTVSASAETTVDQLLPGGYNVAVEGLTGGEVAAYGEVAAVSVLAGRTTPVSVSLASFTPALGALPATATAGQGIPITFGAVAGAAGYTVEFGTDPGFAGAQSVQTGATSVTIQWPTPGTVHVRVRARTRFGASGRPSARGSIDVRPPAFVWNVIAAGGGYTCGVGAGGASYCWGFNAFGQLGDGTSTDRALPTRVAGGLTFTTIATGGGGHTCALTAAGAAHCWGFNADGRVGDGSTVNRGTPTPVSGGNTYAHIALGGPHSCGLTQAGEAFCWGLNADGQLGDGSTTNRSVPARVAGGMTFAAGSLTPGAAHTCAATAAGEAYCWGSNTDGRLGDGTTVRHLTPTRVGGTTVFAPSSITAGGGHTCALNGNGEAFCWGLNQNGQLGDGTTVSRSLPTRVSGGHVFAPGSLVAGAAHTCGVTTAGAALCWGDNRDGRLGDGTVTDRNVPTAVSGALVFAPRSLQAQISHTCGLTVGGEAFCWGDNQRGQLGDGSNINRLVPGRVRDP